MNPASAQDCEYLHDHGEGCQRVCVANGASLAGADGYALVAPVLTNLASTLKCTALGGLVAYASGALTAQLGMDGSAGGRRLLSVRSAPLGACACLCCCSSGHDCFAGYILLTL